jgi:hypothetical protein
MHAFCKEKWTIHLFFCVVRFGYVKHAHRIVPYALVLE